MCADERRGLEPAAPARQDSSALAAFLTSFGGAGLDELGDDRGRRAAGVQRCQYHAQYCGCGFRCSCFTRGTRGKRGTSTALSGALVPRQETEHGCSVG